MRRYRNTRPYQLLSAKHRGKITIDSVAVVMNNAPSRTHKLFIPYFITENPDFYIGENTVAVFRITRNKLKQEIEAKHDQANGDDSGETGSAVLEGDKAEELREKQGQAAAEKTIIPWQKATSASFRETRSAGADIWDIAE